MCEMHAVAKACLHCAIGAVFLLGGGSDRARAQNANIAETLVASTSFQTATTALRAAHLVETLETRGPLTVFVPNEEAFAKIPRWQLNRVLMSEPTARVIAAYHIVPGTPAMTWLSAHPFAAQAWRTLNGRVLFLTFENGAILVNRKARVISAGVSCTNGTIYEVDSVLLPY